MFLINTELFRAVSMLCWLIINVSYVYHSHQFEFRSALESSGVSCKNVFLTICPPFQSWTRPTFNAVNVESAPAKY